MVGLIFNERHGKLEETTAEDRVEKVILEEIALAKNNFIKCFQSHCISNSMLIDFQQDKDGEWFLMSINIDASKQSLGIY